MEDSGSCDSSSSSVVGETKVPAMLTHISSSGASNYYLKQIGSVSSSVGSSRKSSEADDASGGLSSNYSADHFRNQSPETFNVIPEKSSNPNLDIFLTKSGNRYTNCNPGTDLHSPFSVSLDPNVKSFTPSGSGSAFPQNAATHPLPATSEEEVR